MLQYKIVSFMISALKDEDMIIINLIFKIFVAVLEILQHPIKYHVLSHFELLHWYIVENQKGLSWLWSYSSCILKIPVQSVPITTNVVSLNPIHGDVYSMQPYVIKFVSDLQQVGSFLCELLFPPAIKLTTTI